MNDVVVGVDQSGTARKAAERAAGLAEALGVNLHVVMCVSKTDSVQLGSGTDQFVVDWRADAEQVLDNLVHELPHDSVTMRVEVGDPAKTLCDEAARLDAQMIVVGNRRVQGLSRVLGSIAGDVIRHAPCDVLVAHTVE